MAVSCSTRVAGCGTIGRLVALCVVALLITVTALALFVLTFDWNRARPYINGAVSEAIGRPFEIEGDLKVSWRRPVGETGSRSWVPWPRFSAQHVTIANPDWTKGSHFATFEEIDFHVKVLPLLAHDIVIPTIRLSNPSFDLERLIDGRNNWTFPTPTARRSGWRLRLQDVGLNQGTIALLDEQNHVQLRAVIDPLDQPIPIGEVLRRQEGSHTASNEAAGKQRTPQQADTALAPPTPAASTAAREATRREPDKEPAAAANRTLELRRHQGQPQYAIAWTMSGIYNHSPVSGSGKLGDFERSSDRALGGLGLGLALVRHLVELHGGTVCCESGGLGQGSTFTVRLPLMQARPVASPPQWQVPSAAGHRLRLLIVDDNADAADALGMLLASCGHEVIVEHHSRRALERALQERPDACLLDIGLPGMDGYELARQLRSRTETACVTLIAVTGYGQDEDRQRSAQAGFHHHLFKPIVMEQLAGLLARIAAKREA